MLDCLENIIGLSQTECSCFDEGKPANANKSESGVFLDQLQGFNLKIASGADDCAKGGIWDRMALAVENAKAEMIKDLLGGIGQNYKPRHEIFSGQLGDVAYKNVQTLTTTYAGIKLYPAQLRGGVIVLKRIGILINASTNVTVKVYKSENGVGKLINTYTTAVPVTPNALTWLQLSTPLELPMYSNFCRVDYFVLLTLDNTTFKPWDNKIDCGCGGVTRPFLKWLNLTGTKGNDPTNFNSFNNTTYLNGLTLDVEVKCKTASIICSEDRPLDFENDSFSQYLAYAVRFRAAEMLYRDILASDQINRFTLMNREEFEKQIIEWNNNYRACISYLVDIINIGNNDCLVCRDNNGFIKTPLLK